MGDDKDKIKELETIAEKYKKRNQYINNWQKNKYYRLTVLIPLADKEKLFNYAKIKGFNSVSDYVKALIDNDMNNQDGTQGTPPDSNENFYDGESLPFE